MQEILSPMPGNVFEIKINVGDKVEDADVVIVLEAMKMEIEVVAPCAGTVESITVKKGDVVDTNQVLGTIK